MVKINTETARLVNAVAPYLPWSGYAPLSVLTAGALLHDIGKTAWPPELHSKWPLLPPDWALIQAHPAAGVNLVTENWPDVHPGVLEIIRLHHARPGGKGYPAEEPPYPVLVVAACEVFDAMTADRAYRKGVGKEVALNEIGGWAPAEVVKALRRWREGCAGQRAGDPAGLARRNGKLIALTHTSSLKQKLFARCGGWTIYVQCHLNER